VTAPVLLCSLADVRRQAGIEDDAEDDWLLPAIDAVSRAVERVARTWLAPRPSATWLQDGSGVRTLRVRRGVSSLAYVGIAWSDQPDDGSGDYEAVPSWLLDPPAAERELDTDAAERIVLPVGYTFPAFLRSVKLTGARGPSETPAREEQITRNAVVRSYRARSGSSGSDLAVPGPDGGMRILAQFAPAELRELRLAYGTGAD
jgi:hypothetical protein